MAGAEPCMLTLTEASRSIREGKLSPVELTLSCLAMIDRFEPQVKAWVTLDRDGALREAARLEDERRVGRMRGLLHGVPIGIKDIFYTAGMRTTAGHAPMAEFVPDYDATSLPSADKRAAYALEHIAFRVGRIEQTLAKLAVAIEAVLHKP